MTERKQKAQKEQQQEKVALLNLDRVKPHNEDAEKAVLGAMMLSANAATIALAALKFQNAFYRPAHQLIFNAMMAISSNQGDVALDFVVVTDYLQKESRLDEVGGATYIAMLSNCVPTAANIEFYIEIVKQNAILRRIISSCSEAILKCYDADDQVNELLDKIEESIFEITQLNESKDLQLIQPLVLDAVDYMMKIFNGDTAAMGIKTGFDQLDRAITGLRPGELIVLAARPSIGKTALALNIAANIALNKTENNAVGFFSLEMPAQQLVVRLLCSEARVNIGQFVNRMPEASVFAEIKRVAADLRKSRIVIDDTGAIDILELRAKARRMKSTENVSAIFIDYLQLIRVEAGRNANRENEVAKISGALKALAMELNIPIVVLAQLNRQAEQGEKPKLSHLRESGAIEQDADVVTLLHRERSKQFDADADLQMGLESELIIAKNRNGATGTQHLLFYPQYTRFESRGAISNEDAERMMN